MTAAVTAVVTGWGAFWVAVIVACTLLWAAWGVRTRTDR